MPKPFSIRISDDIAALLAAPEPVVALNLMGLSLLSDKDFNPNNTVFWCDGVLSSLACTLAGISIKRQPGRELLAEALKYLLAYDPERPVAVLGADGPIEEFSRLLKKEPVQVRLPWLVCPSEAAQMDFSKLNAGYIVFLAIGSPKQEWIAEAIYQKVGAKCICVGGAVNMLVGREKIAPLVFQKCGLEWVYRLFTEPKRRLRRLFSTLPQGIRNLRYFGSLTYFN
ncbi:MAG: WecB/TagA/CpsF family glycosyltransferase [Candidatus Puniceispirillaceae bacterium]